MVAIGWRSWRQWRRTGDPGYRLRGGGPAARVASALLTVGFAASVIAPILDLARKVDLIGVLRHDAVRVGGLTVMAVAIVLVVRAQLDLRDSWRIGVDDRERTELVVDRTFALARNPIYTGMVATAVGAAMAVPNWFALAAPAFVLAGVQVQVRKVEEPYLLAVHGDAYRHYTARVGRFVPGVGRGVGNRGAPPAGPVPA